jgi:CheY-like chemotaxis protein
MIRVEVAGAMDTGSVLGRPQTAEQVERSAASADMQVDTESLSTANAEEEDWFSDKPFDFAEEESKTALVCETDPQVRKKIAEVLNTMEYHITEATGARDALKRLRFHVYDIIIVNENFDAAPPETSSVMAYLERMEMDIRRQIFVVLFSKQHQTMDHMLALKKSVNMIFNMKHIDKIGAILGRGLADRDLFYRIYYESQTNLGLA